MTKEELLENKIIILSIALDRVWEHLTIEQQKDKEWIWKDMDDAIQNEENNYSKTNINQSKTK